MRLLLSSSSRRSLSTPSSRANGTQALSSCLSSYVASSLESADYPNLIAKGERVATIAVPTILASYNWRPETPRHRRVERFVEEFFSRIDKLKSPGFDPKWKEIDVKTGVPGIGRSRAAQNWIDRANPVRHSGKL